MINDETLQELPVTFIPQLYLQRRRWVFETMTREGVNSVRVFPLSAPQRYSVYLPGRRYRMWRG